MASTGLSERELDLIRGVLARHPGVTGALLFGSRAKGTAAPASDIDLALAGIDDPLRAEAIASELEELPMPHRFDIKALAAIQRPQGRRCDAGSACRPHGDDAIRRGPIRERPCRPAEYRIPRPARRRPWLPGCPFLGPSPPDRVNCEWLRLGALPRNGTPNGIPNKSRGQDLRPNPLSSNVELIRIELTTS